MRERCLARQAALGGPHRGEVKRGADRLPVQPVRRIATKADWDQLAFAVLVAVAGTPPVFFLMWLAPIPHHTTPAT